jgi:hypothetical protein
VPQSGHINNDKGKYTPDGSAQLLLPEHALWCHKGSKHQNRAFDHKQNQQLCMCWTVEPCLPAL